MTAGPFRQDDPLRVTVVAWDAPYPADGGYVRRFYMSQLGPTGTALLQTLAGAGTRVWRVGDLAARLGLAGKLENSSNNPLGRSLDRLEKFRLIEHAPGDSRALFVRSAVHRLAPHQVARMSPEAQRDHAAYVAAWDADMLAFEAQP